MKSSIVARPIDAAGSAEVVKASALRSAIKCRIIYLMSHHDDLALQQVVVGTYQQPFDAVENRAVLGSSVKSASRTRGMVSWGGPKSARPFQRRRTVCIGKLRGLGLRFSEKGLRSGTDAAADRLAIRSGGLAYIHSDYAPANFGLRFGVILGTIACGPFRAFVLWTERRPAIQPDYRIQVREFLSSPALGRTSYR